VLVIENTGVRRAAERSAARATAHSHLAAMSFVPASWDQPMPTGEFNSQGATRALRDDCGVVGATVLNIEGTVVTAGLACMNEGTYLNPFDGLALLDPGYMGLARVVRAVPSIGSQVFAFRTSRLSEVNGLASLSEDSLSEVCTALVQTAHRWGLKVIHTPWAIASLRSAASSYAPRQGEGPPRRLMLNPNLEQFPNLTTILKAGIH
jgi:hypothetical protein